MSTDAAAVQQALGDRYEVVDFEEFLQILDLEGHHLALVGYDPLQVEVELSVVFLNEDKELDDLVDDAHRILTDVHEATWAQVGFEPAEQGEVREGTVIDDEDRVIRSYDLPTTVRARDVAQVKEIIEWVGAQDTDFVI